MFVSYALFSMVWAVIVAMAQPPLIAGALLVAGRGSDWPERAAMAAEALDSGAALALLNKWIALAK